MNVQRLLVFGFSRSFVFYALLDVVEMCESNEFLDAYKLWHTEFSFNELFLLFERNIFCV
jgi:hypothetical protein